MQYLTFFLNKIYFGIDVLQVQEIIGCTEMTPVPLAPQDVLGLINLRGQIITVIDTKSRLDITSFLKNSNLPEPNFTSDKYNIILNKNHELVGLSIDDVGDIIELSDSELKAPPTGLKGKMRQVLYGTYELVDKFLLILDVEKLLSSDL